MKETRRSLAGKGLCAVGILLTFLLTAGFLNAYASPADYTASGAVTQEFAVLESVGGTYYGPVSQLVYTGVGEFQHLDGGIYQGNFQNSRRSGEGTFTWENGDRYTGTWADDAMVNGTYRFADGRTWTGTFADNQFQSGTFSLGDAATDGITSLTAAYTNGTIDTLTCKASDGSSYDGALTGWATIFYSDGSSYDGEVRDGSREGNGTYRWKSKGSVTAYYEGQWSGGEMSGTGTYHYSSQEYPCLKGTFSHNKPTGTAVYYQTAGKTFTSSWSNGTCTAVAAS